MNTENLLRLEEKQKAANVPGFAWVILSITLLAGVSAPLNQFKVPPVMPMLMDQFQLDLVMAGMLMSIFAITGLALALPAGIILQKLGARASGLIAIGCLLLGSVMGALSNQAYLLFTSRLIEGMGMGLIAVVAPALITSWFPPEKRGLPLGIWATWVSLGSLIIYNVAPYLAGAAGWQAVWWAGAAFSLMAFCLYGLIVRMPRSDKSNFQTTTLKTGKTMDLRQVLANPDIWLLSLAFGCFNLVVIGVIATYFPTYLKVERGFSLANASLITSLKMLVVVITAPLAGWLSDRVGSPRLLILISYFALAIFMIFPFSITGQPVMVAMIILGIIAGSIPTATFSAVPEIMGSPQAAGMGMAVIMIGQNLGQLVGPLIFARLVESLGWVVAGYWMIPVLGIGIVATWFTKMR